MMAMTILIYILIRLAEP